MVMIEIDSAHHGIASRRVRVVVIGALRPNASQDDCDAAQLKAEDLEEYLRISPCHLHDVLMTFEDPIWYQCLELVHATKRQQRANEKKWLQKHQAIWHGAQTLAKKHISTREVWREHSQQARRYASEVAEDFNLTAREKDILKYDRVVHGNEYVYGTGPILLDISQSIDRVQRGHGVCPTILPGGKLFMHPAGCKTGLRPPCLLFGLEARRCQGLSEVMIPGQDMIVSSLTTILSTLQVMRSAFPIASWRS